MSVLTKIYINTNESKSLAYYIIQEYVTRTNYSGFIMVDYKNRIITDPNKQYIAQDFLGNIVFMSANSFQQNHRILSRQIRKCVNDLVKNYDNKSLLTLLLGGESYIYGLINSITCDFYTNSEDIYRDSIFNSKIYNIRLNSYLVDYNRVTITKNYEWCIINMSKLSIHLLDVLNRASINNIIIINCHSDDFWKKIKLLNNYYIVFRKQFICDKVKYYITVNLLTKKNN